MENKKQITKHQHYVPRFYLKLFLNASNQVEILDCNRKILVAPRGPKGICYDDFFYGVQTGQQDEVSQYIEDSFRKMEDFISNRLNDVIDELLKNERIANDDKWLIAFLMSMLWMRGPLMRNQINRMMEDVTKWMMEMQFSHPKMSDAFFDHFDKDTGSTTSPEMRGKIRTSFRDKDYSLKFANTQHLMMFDSIQNFANLFYGQDWVVYISQCSKKFITSDNPVVVIPPKRKGIYGPTFLERTHIFPLSPSVCIETRYPRKDNGKKLHRKTIFSNDDRRILALNTKIAGHAHEYAYATEKESLEDILGEIKRWEEFLANPRGQMWVQSQKQDELY